MMLRLEAFPHKHFHMADKQENLYIINLEVLMFYDLQNYQNHLLHNNIFIYIWMIIYTCMQPFVVDQRNFNLLIWVVTGKGVIENHDVQSTTITNVTVTSTSPMLPLAYLVIKQIVNDMFFS